MAFPTLESVTESSFDSASTTHNVSMPASVSSDDLLLMFFSPLDQPTVTTPSGWTLLDSDEMIQGTAALYFFGKKATGTEGGTTVNVGTDVSCTAAAQVYHITGWGGTLASDIDSASDEYSDSNPDPPSVTAG